MMFFTSSGSRTESPERLSVFGKARTILTGVNVPRPEAGLTAAEFSPGAQVLTIDAGGGVTLEAWHVPLNAEKPLVLLFHGYATEKSSLIPAANGFLALGHSVMLLDFRGSGGSSESYTTLGVDEALDVAAAVSFGKERLGYSRVILFGQSMGAAAILRAIAHQDVVADGVILESVFDTMRTTVGNRFRAMNLPAAGSAELLIFWGGRQAGFNAFRHNPMEDAAAVHSPVLFLHGALDPRATLAEARRVYEAVPGDKRLEVFEDAGHVTLSLYDSDRWISEVSAFLSELETQ